MSQEKLEQAKRNWEAKLAHYEYELSITADPSRKFELPKRIQECQKEIEKLEKIINSSGSVNDPEISDNLNQPQNGMSINQSILIPLIIGLLINVLTPSIVQKPYLITVFILSLILALSVIYTRGRHWKIVSGVFIFILLLVCQV